jgi:hypothetical protein
MTESAWLKDQKYLPRFMRDFHDQKGVFKWIWRQIEKQKAADPSISHCLGDTNWIAAHVFVIDYFLWYMARHGYTLQPMRKHDWPVADWDRTIADMKNEDATAFRAMLDADIAKRNAAAVPVENAQ